MIGHQANLGKGLNGVVTGKVARISSITIDKHILNNVITGFPDQTAIQYLTNTENRNGSIGAGILKRFVTVFDLPHERLYLKRTGMLKQPFNYDKTGIIIVAEGENYDTFRITGIIAKTPGEKSGLKKNDVILAINGTQLKGLHLGEVVKVMEEAGRMVYFDIDRDGEVLQLKMRLFKAL